MSVINQVLIDLERRRASSAERSVVPNHVRALPEGESTLRWGWIAAGGLAVIVAIAAAWAFLSGFELPAWRAKAPIAPLSTEAAIEKMVADSAGVKEVAQPSEEGQRGMLASRLSFELSNPPETPAPPRADSSAPRSPLPAARVLGKTGVEPATEREEPAAPMARLDRAKAPAVVAAAKPAAGVQESKPEIEKLMRQPTPRDQSEIEYRKGTAALHQGRLAEAQEGFQAALELFPANHSARQALIGVLVEGRKTADAERVLQEGVRLAPAQLGFVMTLARLQVDRGDTSGAIATLQKGSEQAQGSADYLAFLAALQQRQGRHEEAIAQFQAALRLRPAAGVWLLGMGMSLQAINRAAEAQEVYQRAKATGSLNPELAAFADQRLRQLQ